MYLVKGFEKETGRFISREVTGISKGASCIQQDSLIRMYDASGDFTTLYISDYVDLFIFETGSFGNRPILIKRNTILEKDFNHSHDDFLKELDLPEMVEATGGIINKWNSVMSQLETAGINVQALLEVVKERYDLLKEEATNKEEFEKVDDLIGKEKDSD